MCVQLSIFKILSSYRDEMLRLKTELEVCYAEDRTESLQIAHAESFEEIRILTATFNAKEKELRDEVYKNIIMD